MERRLSRLTRWSPWAIRRDARGTSPQEQTNPRFDSEASGLDSAGRAVTEGGTGLRRTPGSALRPTTRPGMKGGEEDAKIRRDRA